MKTFFPLGLVTFLLFAAFALGDCPATLGRLNGIIARNHFQTQRDLMAYANYLPDSFLKRIGQLGKNSHWLDAGSGEGQALKDFFDGELLNTHGDDPLIHAIASKPTSEKPRVTGVSYKMEGEKPENEKLHFLTGKYFEDIPTDEIPKADLITDLYGVATYSPRFEQVLSKYHAILKPGGKAYLFLGFIARPHQGNLAEAEKREAPFVSSRVKRVNGEVVSLVDWAMALPGFKAILETQGPPNARYPIPTTLVLEKTDEKAEIPFLRLTGSDLNTPPTRHYQEVNP